MSVLFDDPPPRQYEEDRLQRQVVQYLRWALPGDGMHYHIPNGGQRHSKAAARLAGLGLQPGMPDLALLYRGRPLYIELKTERGSLSMVQRQMHRKLSLCGAEVYLCRSLEAVENCLIEAGVKLKARLP